MVAPGTFGNRGKHGSIHRRPGKRMLESSKTPPPPRSHHVGTRLEVCSLGRRREGVRAGAGVRECCHHTRHRCRLTGSKRKLTH